MNSKRKHKPALPRAVGEEQVKAVEKRKTNHIDKYTKLTMEQFLTEARLQTSEDRKNRMMRYVYGQIAAALGLEIRCTTKATEATNNFVQSWIPGSRQKAGEGLRAMCYLKRMIDLENGWGEADKKQFMDSAGAFWLHASNGPSSAPDDAVFRNALTMRATKDVCKEIIVDDDKEEPKKCLLSCKSQAKHCNNNDGSKCNDKPCKTNTEWSMLWGIQTVDTYVTHSPYPKCFHHDQIKKEESCP